MPNNDADLVARLQTRQAEAVGEMLEQYADRLFNYAYYHSGDYGLAEDITSETFTRVIEKIGTYVQRDVPFKAWLFRIAHNLLVDYFRQRKRATIISLDGLADDSSLQPASSDWGAADGGTMAEQYADHDELKTAIAALPEEQRSVFILRFIEGFNLEEVANLTGRSIAAVKSLQYRAVRKLRESLIDTRLQDDGPAVSGQEEFA